MPLSSSPQPAENIINFGGEPDPRAAKLDYGVPLPNQQRNRRVIEVADVAAPGSFKESASSNATERLNLKASGGGSGAYTFDQSAATQLWFTAASANGVPGDKLADLERWIATPTQQPRPTGSEAKLSASDVQFVLERVRPGIATSASVGVSRPPTPSLSPRSSVVGLTPTEPDVQVPELLPVLLDFHEKLGRGTISIPRGDGAGGVVTSDTSATRKRSPRFFLIEEWAVSSFLGDYGLGRTVKTMTLLPGEQLTLRIRTWRSSERSIAESSSIFDSAAKEAQDRFQNQVQQETTDKSTKSKVEEWHAEANVGATWGWGAATVSGGGSGQYQSGREQFARQVNDAVQEHARSESSKRETTVTSATELTEKREDEENTERVIRNVNLRHTLNVVFRELNQRYDTYVHLRDIRIGFTDGSVNSWREVPISELLGLLRDVLEPGAVADAAKKMLRLAVRAFDVAGNAVPLLEKRTWSPDAQTWSDPTDVSPGVGGDVEEAPTDTTYYRFKRGPLGAVGTKVADGAAQPNNLVEGVVARIDSVVLRTDSLVGEALLGQADALDEYAMASQRADAEAKEVANQRNAIVNGALKNLKDSEIVDAYVRMLTSGPARLDLRQVTNE